MGGRVTLFLAVEEIGDVRGAEGVYAEGFATALTLELLPEYGLAEHLWFGAGYDEWLVECERALPAARRAILTELEPRITRCSGATSC